MMPFIGVRISWLILARKSDFARLASSAAWRWRRRGEAGLSRVNRNKLRRRFGGSLVAFVRAAGFEFLTKLREV